MSCTVVINVFFPNILALSLLDTGQACTDSALPRSWVGPRDYFGPVQLSRSDTWTSNTRPSRPLLPLGQRPATLKVMTAMAVISLGP